MKKSTENMIVNSVQYHQLLATLNEDDRRSSESKAWGYQNELSNAQITIGHMRGAIREILTGIVGVKAAV